jgi:RNA polymerase sigma-70 factor (ECF subfamily)
MPRGRAALCSTRVFPNTRWSVVLAARQRPSPESAAALEAICRAYWYPLYAFVRQPVSNGHEQRIIAQMPAVRGASRGKRSRRAFVRIV